MMHALYQRLKELDWDTFQRLTQQVLSEKHPGLEIRHVEGASGDKGLDLFEGVLTDQPTIWQCKHFANGLTPKQRPQVKQSLTTALTHFRPKQWILVVPVDLDAKAHEWLQKLTQAYSDKTAIGLFQASDIVRELLHRRSIRDAFFPGAVIDAITLNRSLQSLESLSTQDVERLGALHLDEQIARLEEVDARFTYRITHNIGPEDTETAAGPLSPTHIASVTKGNQRTDIFVRDVAAIRLDPPTIKLSFSQSGKAKFKHFVETGKAVSFTSAEVSKPSFTLDSMLDSEDLSDWNVILSPATETTSKVLSWRVTYQGLHTSVTYDFVKFGILASGTKLMEVKSLSRLPINLTFDIPLVKGVKGNFHFEENFEGFSISTIKKAVQARRILMNGGSISIYSLDVDGHMATFACEAKTNEEIDDQDKMLLFLADVADFFKTDFALPSHMSALDVATLGFLEQTISKQYLAEGRLGTNVEKTETFEAFLKQHSNGRIEIDAISPTIEPNQSLFGVSLVMPPLRMRSSDAHIEDPIMTIERFANAKLGESLPVRFIARNIEIHHSTDLTDRFMFWPAEEGE